AAEVAFMAGVPLAWAILLLFHPGGDGTDIYGDLRDDVTPFLVVHIGMLVFIPLLAVVVLLLLRGIAGTAARVSRIALAVFVVFYSAWEVLQGIANGVLAHYVNGLPQEDRATGAGLVQDFAEHPLVREMGVFASIGTVALIVALLTAGIALRAERGAPLAVPVLLTIAGFLIAAHPPPYGPVGLVLFVGAVLLYVHYRGGARGKAWAGRGSTASPGEVIRRGG
ncbi:MAG: hypothetical protein QOG77_3628, partial [Solirubrobacteraceae bacterium]|nr:hypothetical protein [Solirubrobacteraceae bacterium]